MNESEPVIQRTFQAKARGLDITGQSANKPKCNVAQECERGTEHRGRRKTDYPGPGHAVRIMDFTLIPYFSGEIYVFFQRSLCLQRPVEHMMGQEGKSYTYRSPNRRERLRSGGGKEADS